VLLGQHADLHQRVIFLTGDTLGAASTAFLAQCGQPWVYKPCDAAAIRHAVQQVLRAGATTDPGARGAVAADTREPRPAEGTLSIVRRGQRYQVRYASNNPYDQDYPMHECADEDTLEALLDHLGTEVETLYHACTIAWKGGVAVLRILLSPGQIQACFPPTA
jgi:hypothetical protein